MCVWQALANIENNHHLAWAAVFCFFSFSLIIIGRHPAKVKCLSKCQMQLFLIKYHAVVVKKTNHA